MQYSYCERAPCSLAWTADDDEKVNTTQKRSPNKLANIHALFMHISIHGMRPIRYQPSLVSTILSADYLTWKIIVILAVWLPVYLDVVFKTYR